MTELNHKEQTQQIDRIAELVADRVMGKILERLEQVGLELVTVDGRREARADLEHLRRDRETAARRSQEREKGVILAAISAAFGILITWITTSYITGHKP